MAVTALLGRFAGGSDILYPVDEEIQSRPLKYDPGRTPPMQRLAMAA